MDASDLKMFEAVARLGGIGRAALELNTVKSNVTARVRSLEQELSTRLFGCSYRQRLETVLATRGIVDVRVLEFGSLDAIVGCVSAGIGITLLPRAVVAKAARGGTVRLHDLPQQEAMVDTLFIHRRDGYVASALLAFMRVVRNGAIETTQVAAQ